jgi:hypothetical protein
MESRKLFWIILGVSVVSAAATICQLVVVYLMSLVDNPDVLANVQMLIAQTTEIGPLKQVCLEMTKVNETERQGRVDFLVYTPLVALFTAGICASLAAWGLMASRKQA